jgi:predicted nucleic acid-binding protein
VSDLIAQAKLAFDSSTIILFLNGQLPSEALLHFQKIVESGKALISAVVRAEVLAWPQHTKASLDVATELLDLCELVSVDVQVADEAARIRRETGLTLIEV